MAACLGVDVRVVVGGHVGGRVHAVEGAQEGCPAPVGRLVLLVAHKGAGRRVQPHHVLA